MGNSKPNVLLEDVRQQLMAWMERYMQELGDSLYGAFEQGKPFYN